MNKHLNSDLYAFLSDVHFCLMLLGLSDDEANALLDLYEIQNWQDADPIAVAGALTQMQTV